MRSQLRNDKNIEESFIQKWRTIAEETHDEPSRRRMARRGAIRRFDIRARRGQAVPRRNKCTKQPTRPFGQRTGRRFAMS
jgi:hypothetical protein